jgi:uncharacterized protein (DUF608 family)
VTAPSWSPKWPRVREYEGEHLREIAMPIGGIGTGTVSLSGHGGLRDFEVRNSPAKGFNPPGAFLAVRAAGAGGPVFQRALEGPIRAALMGVDGTKGPNAGMPRFACNDFASAYPLAQVRLWGQEAPLAARLEMFNPLVPADTRVSGMPFLAIRIALESRSDEPLALSVSANLPNFAGVNERKAVWIEEGLLRGVLLSGREADDAHANNGTVALATIHPGDVTSRTAWRQRRPDFSDGLDVWSDMFEDGRFDQPRAGEMTTTGASIAAQLNLAPNDTAEVVFLIGWHFPNRVGWSKDGVVGNHYATHYEDAWEVLKTAARDLESLEAQTVQFVHAICSSNLPSEVIESALNNLIPLRSETSFLSADGRLRGWEGCNDQTGSCEGSCTHVWNYEYVTPYLFGDLARGMRELEFSDALHDDGSMSFRIGMPGAHARDLPVAAADGQMGSVVRLYREWLFSADTEFLRRTWPGAKRALEFAWLPGGWDADQDGLMEGCQHNTMDVEYFGPNPEVGLWYLAALAAAARMARAMGEEKFASRCEDLHTDGARRLEAELFNGEYYEQKVLPIPDHVIPALGFFHNKGQTEPQFQVGPGCLAGQLVGDVAARLAGLGPVADSDHSRVALKSVHRHNFTASLRGHFNEQRSYAVDGEAGTVMCTYPRGGRPDRPFPYWSEVWTGIEYTAALGMIQAGLRAEALQLVRAVRSRHDGSNRNPFDEPECGHHYARAMSAWGLIPALTGFHWSALEGRMEFAVADERARWFWATGHAWGTVLQEPRGDGLDVELGLMGGQLPIRSLLITGKAEVPVDRIVPGEVVQLRFPA